MGSAAVFFELCPPQAVLSDANEELVECFKAVASAPEEVMARLDKMPNTPEYFQSIRALTPSDLDSIDRAVRVIYLNKTSFRGLWRVNRKGQFNTPYGAYSRPYYNRSTLLRASRLLSAAEVRLQDFEAATDEAQEGDWVYLDPPYVPLGGWADFKRYTPNQFGESDHARLCEAMRRASSRGVFVMMTNSDTPFVRDLFEPHFRIFRLPTRRDINLQSSNRGSWDLVITNYSPHLTERTSYLF